MRPSKEERRRLRLMAENPTRCYCVDTSGHVISLERFVRHIPSGAHYKDTGGDVYRCQSCGKEWVDAPTMAGGFQV